MTRLNSECVPMSLKLSSNVIERKPLTAGEGAGGGQGGHGAARRGGLQGRGLHSFTVELNLSNSRTHS